MKKTTLHTGEEMPEAFALRMESLLGAEAEAFFSAMTQAPATSIKANRRKVSSVRNVGYDSEENVKWCKSGTYLPERPKFTLNPLLHAGAFYVQDASSMIYETLTERIIEELGSPSGLNILDMCAAPGGKTTSMINALPDGTLVVANEINPQRVKALRENLLKWGYPEILVTRAETSRFAACGEMFDIVAVDAPCSGEGMMRKEAIAATQWSERLVEQCSALQKEILANAEAALKAGGFLIYSTCTFNTAENEDNLRFAIEELGLIPATPDLTAEYGIGRQLAGQYPALRFMPHLTKGEGLFAALLRKPGSHTSGSPKERERLKSTLRRNMPIVLDGFPSSIEKGRKIVPAPEQPLACNFPAEFPRVELTEEEALRYLRHEALRLPEGTPLGYVAVCYKEKPLGFANNIGSRANNLYPSEWRIRNL